MPPTPFEAIVPAQGRCRDPEAFGSVDPPQFSLQSIVITAPAERHDMRASTPEGSGGKADASSMCEDDSSNTSVLTASPTPTWRAAGCESNSSFGGIAVEDSSRVSLAAWKASCCCDCVPLRCGATTGGSVAPVTFEPSCDEVANAAAPVHGGRSNRRAHHRRGRSAAVRQGVLVPPRVSEAHISSQPRDREHRPRRLPHAPFHSRHLSNASSGVTSTSSSLVSEATAAAAAPGQGSRQGGKAPMEMTNGATHPGGRPSVNGGRRSGSWGGSSSLDREFHVILRAGVDVYKHCSAAKHKSDSWRGMRRIKGWWSRKSPMDDANQGLVTLFMDKEREHLCWCPPGAAELYPDLKYVLKVHEIVEVIPGYELRPRCVALQSCARARPLVIEVDSDDLYDVLYRGFARILERNTLRDAAAPAQPGGSAPS